MLWQFYLRAGKVYVPTVAQTEAGYYLDIEPVVVVPISDAGLLKSAIVETMGRGNPVVPTPTRDAFPKPVVLSYAKVKSWSGFEKEALNWSVVCKAGEYQIKPGRKRPDRGWEEDTDRIETLPPGSTPEDVAGKMVSLMQSAQS